MGLPWRGQKQTGRSGCSCCWSHLGARSLKTLIFTPTPKVQRLKGSSEAELFPFILCVKEVSSSPGARTPMDSLEWGAKARSFPNHSWWKDYRASHLLTLLLEELTALPCHSLELSTPGERTILDSWDLETQKVRNDSSSKVFSWSVGLLQTQEWLLRTIKPLRSSSGQ